MAYKLPNPERERTERNRELKRLRAGGDPGEAADRAVRAADLAVVFHEERSINQVMELTQMVLDGVDDGIDVLVTAYLAGTRNAEEQMERLAMLANTARWIETDALAQTARTMGVEAAVSWCTGVDDEIEQADRLSLVERRFDAEFRREVQQQLG
jgi:hypothetical protein